MFWVGQHVADSTSGVDDGSIDIAVDHFGSYDVANDASAASVGKGYFGATTSAEHCFAVVDGDEEEQAVVGVGFTDAPRFEEVGCVGVDVVVFVDVGDDYGDDFGGSGAPDVADY